MCEFYTLPHVSGFFQLLWFPHTVKHVQDSQDFSDQIQIYRFKTTVELYEYKHNIQYNHYKTASA